MIYDSRNLASKDTFDLLDDIGYMQESISYLPEMVSIRYSTRLDQNMIQLESMIDYAYNNSIYDADRAIRNICEANHVDENISFCVNETSLYLDPQIVDTVSSLRENGYRVTVMPILKSSIYYTKLQEALAMDEDCIDYDTSENLMQYVNEGIIGNALDRAKTRVSGIYSSAKENLSNNVAKVKQGRETLANKYSETKESLANKYAALKKTIGEKVEAAKTATGEAKVKLLQQINKLKQAASNLKARLSSSSN